MVSYVSKDNTTFDKRQIISLNEKDIKVEILGIVTNSFQKVKELK